jgi:molecular chaperone GrpE
MIDHKKKKGSRDIPVESDQSDVDEQDVPVVDELADPSSPDEIVPDVTSAIREELENTRKELAKMTENWQRERASFQNFKHRIDEEKREIRKYACFDFALEIIRVLDYFESSVTFGENLPEGAQNVIIGVKYTIEELTKILAEIEVHPIEAERGQLFDSVLMQAVERRSTDKAAAGTVLEAVRRGWRMHDRVMRPVQVVVADAMPEEKDKFVE